MSTPTMAVNLSINANLGRFSLRSFKKLRWPTRATSLINQISNSNSLLQIQIPYFKFKFLTSNSNSLLQIQIPYSKFKFITPNSSLQIQIHHSKFKFVTPNSNSSLQIQISHSKFKFLTPNSNFSLQIQLFKFLPPKTAGKFVAHAPDFH
jgi:hypothetical protein